MRVHERLGSVKLWPWVVGRGQFMTSQTPKTSRGGELGPRHGLFHHMEGTAWVAVVDKGKVHTGYLYRSVLFQALL